MSMSEQIISQEGYEKLKAELDFLSKNKRKEIAARIQTAKEQGDLSENAEYSEAKDAQAFNEGRISEINSILKNVTIVESVTSSKTVSLGSMVTVEKDGEQKEFTIVSFNEVDPLAGKISNESPLGQAFLGKKKGDNFLINTPRGEVKYKIIKIN